MALSGMKKRCVNILSFLILAGLLPAPGIVPGAGPHQAIASELPEWVKNFKLKGDVRFRYQGQEANPEGNERKRYRVRFRPGVTADVTDKWAVSFGLATGGDDLRSTNQTFKEFSTYDIRLDYVYATYEPTDNIDLLVGKMKNPIWNSKDLIWDSDIRPDGVAAKITFNSSESISWFLTPGFFSLGEYRDSKGDKNFETLMVLQGGFNARINKNTSLKLGATAHLFNDIEVGSFAESAGTNTLPIENAYSVEAEFGYTGLPLYMGVIGQYVMSDADEEDTGYLLGVKIGDKKVKAPGQWQFKYNYRSLENNAFPDFLMDSDAYDGATGAEGSEFEVVIGLARNITIGVDYYMMEDRNSDGEQDLVQLDLVIKF